MCDAERILSQAQQERDDAMRDAEASYAGVTDAMAHWKHEMDDILKSIMMARSEAKSQHEDALRMLQTTEESVERQRRHLGESEQLMSRTVTLMGVLEKRRRKVTSESGDDTPSPEASDAGVTDIDFPDDRHARMLTEIDALSQELTGTEELERGASIARSDAEGDMRAATSEASLARMALIEARHRRDVASDEVFAMNQAAHESGLGRQMLDDAKARLDTVSKEIAEEGMSGLARAEQAVARLKAGLASRPEDADGISNLLRAAEWELERAKRYVRFASMLPSVADDIDHTEIRSLYQSSDSQAFIVTADRETALTRYSEAYAEMAKIRDSCTGDDEHHRLLADRDKARERLLVAEQEVRDAQSSLDQAYAVERQAWDKLDEATKNLVIRDSDLTRIRATFDTTLETAIQEVATDSEAIRRKGYRQSLAFRDAADMRDSMRELTQAMHMAERRLATSENEERRLATMRERLVKVVRQCTPSSYLSDPRSPYDRVMAELGDAMGHELLLTDMSETYASLMKRERHLRDAKKAYDRAKGRL